METTAINTFWQIAFLGLDKPSEYEILHMAQVEKNHC